MDGLESKLERTEEGISELEDRTKEITQSEQQRENGLKNKQQKTELKGPMRL